MDFFTSAFIVIISSFLMFTLTLRLHDGLGNGWGWVIAVSGIALINMLVHRMMGNTINPPFFTSALFAIALLGRNVSGDPEVSSWNRKAIWGVAIGTLIGWLTFIEVHSA